MFNEREIYGAQELIGKELNELQMVKCNLERLSLLKVKREAMLLLAEVRELLRDSFCAVNQEMSHKADAAK